MGIKIISNVIIDKMEYTAENCKYKTGPKEYLFCANLDVIGLVEKYYERKVGPSQESIMKLQFLSLMGISASLI